MRPLLAALAVLAATLGLPAHASQENGWKLRAGIALLDPAGDEISVDVGSTAVSSDLDSGLGAGLHAEYRFSRRLGVEFGAMAGASVSVTNDLFGSEVDVSSYVPVTVGLDVHLTPDRPVDLYIGPQLAWTHFSGVDASSGSFGSRTSVSVDSDIGIAAVLGLDVPVGDRGWLFQSSLRYIEADMESDGPNRVTAEFDPRALLVGFGYRF